jgi:transposase-like protein
MSHHRPMDAYSEDLRLKLVQALRQRRMTKSEAARAFSVSLSSVKRYAKTSREALRDPVLLLTKAAQLTVRLRRWPRQPAESVGGLPADGMRTAAEAARSVSKPSVRVFKELRYDRTLSTLWWCSNAQN